jgi:mRNA interferase MazF
MVANAYIPDYGDVVWVVLEPRVGHEQSGRRPAIVISNKAFSTHTSLAIMCPITSKAKGLPFEVELNGAVVKGAVLPIHAKSLDWAARKVQFIEKAPVELTDTVAGLVGTIIGLGD